MASVHQGHCSTIPGLCKASENRSYCFDSDDTIRQKSDSGFEVSILDRGCLADATYSGILCPFENDEGSETDLGASSLELLV